MDSSAGTVRRRWVAPFGDPRIEDRMRLPGAFRSLPRPSSPAAAKASAVRPCILDAWNRFPAPRTRGALPLARGRPLPGSPPRGPRSRAPPGISAKPFSTVLYLSFARNDFLAVSARNFRGEGPRLTARGTLPRSVRPVVKEHAASSGRGEKNDRGEADGGRTWTRTMDLVLIRDAL